MSDGFDAYHKWLAIPPSEQPPNHYRLLGLGLFESDPDVIAAAADRQMSHIQTYKNGPRAELSQKLLNEISAAKLCLLKPQKKGPYDAQLRQTLDSPQPGVTPRTSTAAAPIDRGATMTTGQRGTPPGPILPPPLAAPPRIDQLDDEAARSILGPRAMLAAGAILIVLLIVAIWIVFKLGRGGDSSTRNESGTATSSSDSVTPMNQQTAATTASTATDAPATKESAPNPPVAHDSAEPAKPISPAVNPADRVAPPALNPTPDVKPADPSRDTPAKPSASDPAAKPTIDSRTAKPAVGADSKLPIPDQTLQATAEGRLAGAFPDSSPQAVLEKSKTLTDGPLVYVALNRALKEAIAGGDVPALNQILDELARRFAVDAVPLRARSYAEVRQHVTSTPSWEVLAQSVLALIDEASKAGHAEFAMPWPRQAFSRRGRQTTSN